MVRAYRRKIVGPDVHTFFLSSSTVLTMDLPGGYTGVAVYTPHNWTYEWEVVRDHDRKTIGRGTAADFYAVETQMRYWVMEAGGKRWDIAPPA